MTYVFETIAVDKETPLFIDLHLDRLEEAMKVLNVTNDKYDRSFIADNIIVKSKGKDRKALKVIVSCDSVVFEERDNVWTSKIMERGLSLCISKLVRNESEQHVYHKTNLNEVLIKELHTVREEGFDDAVFFNTKGHVTETSIANIFIVKEGVIKTPPVSDGLLNGTIRKHLMANADIREESLSRADLLDADEVFLTNSLMGIMPVASIYETQYKRAETEKLFPLYESLTEEQITSRNR